MRSPRSILPYALPLALLAASCAALPVSAGGASGRIVDTATSDAVTVGEAADALAGADVVFLGEEHDSPEAHALQLALTEALHARRPDLVVSLEMLERDAQPRVDLYLRGAIDRESFESGTRLWGNWDHYAPVVELAREEGLPVLAANCYRPIAARVAREGLHAAAGDPWAARVVDAGPGEYRDRFLELMGGMQGHGGPSALRIFAAQCVKDDTMAESIARHLDAVAPAEPLVVHWCGKFHSDRGLGTVERLLARRPDLDVAVVSTLTDRSPGRDLTDEERELGDYVFLVPWPESREE